MKKIGMQHLREISGRFGLAAMLALSGLAVLAAATGCGGKRQDKAWLEEIPGRILEPEQALRQNLEKARANLAAFYLATFPRMLDSEFYKTEQPITLGNHLAHRLWVPEHDPGFDKSVRLLGEMALVENVPGPDGTEVRYARFDDAHQLHRDQYAMNMSEMGYPRLGAATLADLVTGAKLDFGAARLSKRGDTPWSLALLAMNTEPGEVWRNLEGEAYDVNRIIAEMVNTPAPSPLSGAFGCYDYHVLYALGAAIRVGAKTWRGEAEKRMYRTLDMTKAALGSSKGRGDGADELVLRIKFGGHLIEAYYRGGPEVFPAATFGREIAGLVETLAADAIKLRRLPVYNGPTDVMIAVPHAIHGVDLALKSLPASPSEPQVR